MIEKVAILETFEGGRIAKVEAAEGQIFDDVVMLYPYGFKSNIKIDDSSLGLMFGSATNLYVIPFDILKEPNLESGEVCIGNFNLTNKLTFLKNGNIKIEAGSSQILIKKDGNIELTTSLAKFSNNIDVSGVVKVDGLQVVGNQGAAIPNVTGVTPTVNLDVEARSTIDLILGALRLHGLIA